MSYTVFARKYRPETFDDVVGQEHITRTLKNAIEQQRLAHAYIFIGPRGTGKTSTARILAKSLNCERAPAPTIHPCGECDSCKEIAGGNSLDVLEFDAASNTQVDKVRELIINNVKYLPARGRFKVYLVDEVHMLSPSSFNALLKTLEEPPLHVKFLFATTDVTKVPTTILSRCQRFDLKRIAPALISNHLLQIAVKETIDLTRAAADAIAHGAEGGMRDAESMLDQLVAFCGNKIEEADVLTVFGLTAQQTISDLCDDLIAGDSPAALGVVHEQAEAGRDLSRLMSDLITHLRNLLVSQAEPAALANELSEEAMARLTVQAGQIKTEKVLELIEQLAAAEQRMKWAPNKKMHFEIAVIRAIQTLSQATLTEVLEALAAIRGGGGSGEPPSQGQKPKATPAPRPARAAPPRAPVAQPPAAAPRVAEPATAAVSAEPVSAGPAAVSAAPPAAVAPANPIGPMGVMGEMRPAEQARSPDRPPAAPELPKAQPAPKREAAPSDPGAIWALVLAEVRRQRPLISAWVEKGALLGIEDGTAEIGFPPSEKLASEYCQQPGNRILLGTVLAGITGQELNLKFKTREGLVVAPSAKPEPKAAPDPAEEFKNDPLIRKALEIFRAEIQPA